MKLSCVKMSGKRNTENRGVTENKKRKQSNEECVKRNVSVRIQNDEQTESEEETHQKEENELNDEHQNRNDTVGSKSSGSGIALKMLSRISFSSLKNVVCSQTLKAIQDMGFNKMTEIQEKCIPPLLEGHDLVGCAKTGSGKTLAFLIPAIELINKLNLKRQDGIGCIIISPTRELCVQIFGVLKELMAYHNHTYGMIMGGVSKSAEDAKLAKGINILVATPGRLLDHLQHTKNMVFENLQCLIIDEVDRILEVGFGKSMKHIIRILPEKRQTMMFSATFTHKTKQFEKLAVKQEPVYVGVDDDKDLATVEGLQQGYVICPSEKKFPLLFTFLEKHCKKKVMVFFSTANSVRFHHELFKVINLPVMSIHGRLRQRKRTSAFLEFCNSDSGILLCTDVAARGLDIRAVDWIVQYDPPDQPKEYIHRVGRTARGEGASGCALLVLRPEEKGFLRYLREARVSLNACQLSLGNESDIQLQLEKSIGEVDELNMLGKKAFKAYVRGYKHYGLKKIFDVHSLNLQKVAKSFGFTVPPKVDLYSQSGKEF